VEREGRRGAVPDSERQVGFDQRLERRPKVLLCPQLSAAGRRALAADHGAARRRLSGLGGEQADEPAAARRRRRELRLVRLARRSQPRSKPFARARPREALDGDARLADDAIGELHLLTICSCLADVAVPCLAQHVGHLPHSFLSGCSPLLDRRALLDVKTQLALDGPDLRLGELHAFLLLLLAAGRRLLGRLRLAGGLGGRPRCSQRLKVEVGAVAGSVAPVGPVGDLCRDPLLVLVLLHLLAVLAKHRRPQVVGQVVVRRRLVRRGASRRRPGRRLLAALVGLLLGDAALVEDVLDPRSLAVFRLQPRAWVVFNRLRQSLDAGEERLSVGEGLGTW